jgi:hypothetical protein
MSKGPSYDYGTVNKPGKMQDVPGNTDRKIAQESQSMPPGMTSKAQDLGTSMKQVPGNPNTKSRAGN